MSTDARTRSKSRRSTEKKPARTKRRRTSAAKSHSRLATLTNSLSLVALSPYRFPLDVERLAVHTLRVGGFAALFFGMVFTYHFIESSVTDVAVGAAQTASIAAHVPCTTNCENARLTPRVTFTYVPGETPSQQVITIDVAKAESVKVYAYETRTGEYYRLGDATQDADGAWQYIWNTVDYVPGDYWIKAVVENRHGTYDRSDSRYLHVN